MDPGRPRPAPQTRNSNQHIHADVFCTECQSAAAFAARTHPLVATWGYFRQCRRQNNNFHNLFDSPVAGHLHGLRQHAAAKIAGRRIVRRMGHCGQDIILCPSHRTTTHIIGFFFGSLHPGWRPRACFALRFHLNSPLPLFSRLGSFTQLLWSSVRIDRPNVEFPSLASWFQLWSSHRLFVSSFPDSGFSVDARLKAFPISCLPSHHVSSTSNHTCHAPYSSASLAESSFRSLVPSPSQVSRGHLR